MISLTTFSQGSVDFRLGKILAVGGELSRLGLPCQSDINDAAYLAGFLACCLSSHVFASASTSIHPKTFLMAVVMARGKQYNLAVPYLTLAYQTLG